MDLNCDKCERPATYSAVKFSSPAPETEAHLAVWGLPHLDVNRDYEVWKFRMQPVLARVTPQHQYLQLMLTHTDHALRRVILTGVHANNSLASNRQILDECFESTESASTHVDASLSRQQHPGERASDDMFQLRQLITRESPTLPTSAIDELLYKRFTQGLSNQDLKTHFRLTPATSASEDL